MFSIPFTQVIEIAKLPRGCEGRGCGFLFTKFVLQANNMWKQIPASTPHLIQLRDTVKFRIGCVDQNGGIIKGLLSLLRRHEVFE